MPLKYSELLTTQNRKMLDSWQIQGRVSFVFDENCKGYLLDMNNGSIACPKNNRESLKLIRPMIMMQVYFYPGKLFTLELIASDSEGTKRRIILTHGKNVVRNLMHARLPNHCIERNTWLHLYINIISLFSISFPTRTFRSLEGIYLSATCKLRRIFSISEMDIDYLLPRGFELPKYLKCKTQCITSQNFEFFFSSPTEPSTFPQIKLNPSSISLPKLAVSTKKNIFLTKSIDLNSKNNDLMNLKHEYIKGISFGAKKYFRKEKETSEVRLRDKLRKITHIHYKESPGEVIEENIVIEGNDDAEMSVIEALQSRGNTGKNSFNTPNFFNSNVKAVLQLRHVTPPFVNIDSDPLYIEE